MSDISVDETLKQCIECRCLSKSKYLNNGMCNGCETGSCV